MVHTAITVNNKEKTKTRTIKNKQKTLFFVFQPIHSELFSRDQIVFF